MRYAQIAFRMRLSLCVITLTRSELAWIDVNWLSRRAASSQAKEPVNQATDHLFNRAKALAVGAVLQQQIASYVTF